MAEQPENETAIDQPEPQQLLDRVPARFRTKRWLISGAIAAGLAVLLAVQCAMDAAARPDAPPPDPVAVATPAPEPAAIPREEYRLPKQYAFVHFVNEMTACYDQNGQVATLETVEADIMVDVPLAASILMRLYADNACEEVEPWHQIPGRAGWMLRASGIHQHLPTPVLEEPK